MPYCCYYNFFQLILFCNHPVTGKIISSKFEVHQNDSLSKALAEAYRVQYTNQSLLLPLFFVAHFLLCPQVMNLAPYIPMGRCRLVKYDHYHEAMDRSFDLDEVGLVLQSLSDEGTVVVSLYAYKMYKQHDIFQVWIDRGVIKQFQDLPMCIAHRQE